MILQSKFIRAAVAGAALVWGAVTLWTEPAGRKTVPDGGKAARYSNPLPIETSSKDDTPQGVSLGDVTAVRGVTITTSSQRVAARWLSPFVCQTALHAFS